MKYKAIIFDFDYTLADATEGIVESYNYAFAQLGMPKQEKEVIRKTVGMTVENSIKQMDSSLDSDTIEILRELFKKRADEVMLDGTKLFEQTEPLINKLKAAGMKIAVVSSKMKCRIEDVFEKENINDCFEVIIGYEEVKKAKPEPEGLLLAISKLSIDKSDVLYVGDSIIDGKAAQAADIDFAAVLTGTTKKVDFADIPCMIIADNLIGIEFFLGL